MSDAAQQQYVSTWQAAEELGVSPDTVIRYIERGRLPGTLRPVPSGHYRVPAASIAALKETPTTRRR